MKVVILAGGKGSRLEEETQNIPKPLVRIGNIPILVHILKIYSHFGFDDFVICLGYKGELIKEYFFNYKKLNSNITIDFKNDDIIFHEENNLNWKISLIDTGINTETGGRIKQIEKYLNNEKFFLTYGDGLSNININKLLNYHNTQKKIVTVTGIRPTSKFGNLKFKKNMVTSFNEKPERGTGLINGGFFVCEPEVFNYLPDDDYWENKPLKNLVKDKQLNLYRHDAFWQCMDTIREKNILEEIWNTGNAPWMFGEEYL